jgi:hypothetical protein
MEVTVLTWVQYGVLGYAALLLHIIFKVTELNKSGQTTTVWEWAKKNKLELISSVIAYHAILFLWRKEGISFFGMLQGQPSGLTMLVGYAGNSIVKSLFASMGKKANVEIPT